MKIFEKYYVVTKYVIKLKQVWFRKKLYEGCKQHWYKYFLWNLFFQKLAVNFDRLFLDHS